MTLLVVDGNNVLVRAQHAMSRPGQVALSADGVLTGPLLVFVNTISKHIHEEKPDKVVVCWDGGRSKFRSDLHPGYKAHRVSGKTDDEQGSFALAKEFLSLANIHHVERPQVEADDLVAWYWRTNRPLDEKVVILSSDKDFLQLLAEDTEVVRISSGGAPTDRWTKERFIAERGYDPRYEGEVMALMGDSGDGVPGLVGVGPKKAVKIMEESGWSWLRVLDHHKVYEHRDTVTLAKRLIDLRDSSMLNLGLDQCPPFAPTSMGDLLYEALLNFLHRYRLDSIHHRLTTDTLWR